MLTDVSLLHPDNELSQADKDQEWQADFETMGSDPDVNNVEYMLSAAREVIFGNEE